MALYSLFVLMCRKNLLTHSPVLLTMLSVVWLEMECPIILLVLVSIDYTTCKVNLLNLRTLSKWSLFLTFYPTLVQLIFLIIQNFILTHLKWWTYLLETVFKLVLINRFKVSVPVPSSSSGTVVTHCTLFSFTVTSAVGTFCHLHLP